MSPQPDALEVLRSKTQASRVEFVHEELASCFRNVETANAAYDSREYDVAKRHAKAAEDGYETIVRFLGEIEEEAQRTEIEHRWNQLRAELDALQARLAEL